MEFNIRKAEPNDLNSLQDLARHTIDLNYRSFLGNAGVDWFISGPSDEYMLENLRDCVVMEIEGQLVAFSVCSGNVIDMMMVRSEHHRKGIGSYMLRVVETALFQYFDALELESFEGNRKANAFYRKNGWKKEKMLEEVEGLRKFRFIKHQSEKGKMSA